MGLSKHLQQKRHWNRHCNKNRAGYRQLTSADKREPCFNLQNKKQCDIILLGLEHIYRSCAIHFHHLEHCTHKCNVVLIQGSYAHSSIQHIYFDAQSKVKNCILTLCGLQLQLLVVGNGKREIYIPNLTSTHTCMSRVCTHWGRHANTLAARQSSHKQCDIYLHCTVCLCKQQQFLCWALKNVVDYSVCARAVCYRGL